MLNSLYVNPKRTWLPTLLYRELNEELLKLCCRLVLRDEAVKKISQEKDPAIRKNIYEKEICPPDSLMIESFFDYLYKIKRRVQKENKSSILEWVLIHELDSLNWQGFVENLEYKKIINQFSKKHSQEIKKIFELSYYDPWDYWLEDQSFSQRGPSSYKLANTYNESLALTRTFYTNLGFEKIFKEITFLPNELGSTFASISFNEAKWINTVHIYTAGIDFKIGSVSFISNLVHEVAHVIQARFIQNPSHDFILPPNPLNEIVAMFFQKLFLRQTFANIMSHKIEEIEKSMQREVQKSLARYLILFELEMKIDNLIFNDQLNAENIANCYSTLLNQYHHFDTSTEIKNYSWLRYFYYLCHPYKTRSYILGEILSQAMLDFYIQEITNEFFTFKANKILKDIIYQCSYRGSYNDWNDFGNACGIKVPLDNVFMLKGIQRVLF